jgi:NAD(P)-dependent dehydrogenase (short-subunit alcohol dehydrogenase family)
MNNREQQNGNDPRQARHMPPLPRQEQEHPGHETKMSPKPDHGEDSYVGHGKLAGKVALVTGADSGIGRAVALAFAREGADVGIGFLEAEQDDANETAQLVRQAGRRALLLPGDISREQTCAAIVQRTVDELGHLDVLVNNAAFQGEAVDKFEDLDGERVRHTLLTNIGGMFFLTRAALPHMRPGSTIINTASINAYQPKPPILDYASTKGAIVTFTKGLGKDLAKRGIRVNAIAPGPVWTPLIVQSYSPEEVERFGQQTPLGRPAQPAELAPAYVFLACDDSRFMTGEVIGLTGGEPLG